MVPIDFLLVILILGVWTTTVVTDESAAELMPSAQEYYESSHQQQEPLFSYSPSKPLRRILYMGSESSNRESVSLPSSYFQPEMRMRSRPLNIFGHYQHHQEVLPSNVAASDLSTTRFRPSPLDPIRSFNEEPNQPHGHFQPLYRLDSASGGGGEDGNYDDRFVYELEEPRPTTQDSRHNFLDSEEEQSDRGNLRNQRPFVYGSPFQNPGHFQPNQYRQPSREGLIFHLYQSYLDSLANNRFRPSAVPKVEVNPRSNRKPELTANIQQEELNRNVIAPPLPPQEILNERPPQDSLPHYVVPIQQEILPSPESLRQNFRRRPFDDDIFENLAKNPTTASPHLVSTIQQETTTTTAPAKIIRVNKGLVRQYQKPNAIPSPTPAQVQALPSAFPALRRESAPAKILQRVYTPEVPKRIKLTTTAAPPPPVLGTEALSQFEEKQRDEYVDLRDIPNDVNTFPTELTEFELDLRAPPNPLRRSQVSSQLSRLPEFYPFTFSDGPRLQNFLEPRQPQPIKMRPEFLNVGKTTPRPKDTTKRPKIGKLLYSHKKTMAKEGGVYGGFQVFSEYHSYGIPVSAQLTPMYRVKTSLVRSQPRVAASPQPNDAGRRRQSLKPVIAPANLNQLVPRTVLKNSGNLKPLVRGRQLRPTVSTEQTGLSIQNYVARTTAPPTVSTPPIILILDRPTDRSTKPQEETETTAAPTEKVTPANSLRKPAGIRKLIARPRTNTFSRENSKEEQNLRQPKVESPKVIIKKVRTRKPGSTRTILRGVDLNSDLSEPVESKPTEFPLKYSSRYRNEIGQIPPTSIPTASVTIASKEELSTPRRPFHSKPRRLFTKVPAKSQSSELPESVLLSPRDVIVNRKPARRIPAGSVSERLKALKNVAHDNDESKSAESFSPSKREIVSNPKNGDNGSRTRTEKGNSTTSEFDSKELSEILGIPKRTNRPLTIPPKTINSSADYENETAEDAYQEYEDEPKGRKHVSPANQEDLYAKSSSHWSIPIVSIPGKSKISRR